MKYIIIIICILLIIYLDICNSQKYLFYNIITISNNYNLYSVWDLYDKSNPSDTDLYNLLKKNISNLSTTYVIPKRLFQIYMFYKAPIPQYIFDNIKKYASNYKYILFDENKANTFLKKYFNSRIIKRFNELHFGAHKADLLRYCYLYIYGGIYIDIKTIILEDLDNIFDNKLLFYTSMCHFKSIIYNGIIASKPKNKLFLKLIWYIINIPLYIINIPIKLNNYASLCRDMYIKIQNDIITNKINVGLQYGKHNDYYLFEEKMDKDNLNMDRYGFKCSIYKKNKKVFITRDPKFPWN